MFEDGPLGIALVDRQGRFLEVNRRFRELTGWGIEALVERTFRDITHPDDLAGSTGLFDAIVSGARAGGVHEKRYVRPDGTHLEARTTLRRISPDQDTASGALVVAIVEDVSDRKRAEREVAHLNRELRTREERYRTLVTNVPGAIYRREMAAPYRLRFVSDALLDIAGVDATRVVEQRWSVLDLVHPDDHHLIHELADRDLGIGESYVVEYRVLLPDGEVRWVHDKGRAIAGRVGADAELFDGVLFDVTQRKLSEQRLREHELRERAREQERAHLDQIEGLTRASLAVNSPLALSEMLDAITRSARQVVGARQAVMLAAPDPEDAPVWAQSVDAELEERGAVAVPQPGSDLHRQVWEEQRTALRAPADLDGDVGPWTGDEALPARGLLAAPMVARDGRTIGMLVLADKPDGAFVAADEALASQLAQTAAVAIEKSRLAELAAAREAVRFRDELMAGMSHDMQTPLSAIVGTTRMLQDDPGAPEEERVLLYDVLARQSARLYTLVQQFLDHARLEVDRPLVVRSRRLDLRSSLTYTQRLFHHQRRIDLDVPEGEVTVLADPDRLQQILGNLVSNAIKFSDDPVTVRVATSPDGPVVVEVVDRGIGMDAEDLEGLFGRFHRGRNAAGTHGTGLGLYVSHAVAEAMGGTLTATSTEGEGTVLRLTLPRADG